MKKFKLLSVALVMFSALGLVSCDSEPVDPVLNNNNGENPGTNPGTNPVGGGTFKVNFGGETFIAETAVAKYEMGLLTIAGAKAPSEVVSVGVDGTTVGTYTNNTMNYIPSANAQTGYMNINPDTFAKNGTVVITEIDYENNTISGTFTFTGYSVNPEISPASITFTNGIFEDVPVTGLPEPGTNPVGEKYMKAKIDGQQVNFGATGGVVNAGILALNGMNAATQQSIMLSLPETITPGTYPLEMFSDYYGTYISFEDGGFSSEQGTITIISHADGWIKGTFQFNGEDFDGGSHSLTQGEFNIQY